MQYRLSESIDILSAPHLRSIYLSGFIDLAGWTPITNPTKLELDLELPSRRSTRFLPSCVNGALSIPKRIHAQLPLLEYLHVEAPAAILQYFLQSLAFPSTAALRLMIIPYYPEPVFKRITSGLMHFIRLRLRSTNAPILRSIEIKSKFTICAITDSGDRGARGFISRVLNALPLEATTHLFAAGPFSTQGLSQTTWRAVFERLPRVVTVQTTMGTNMPPVVGGLVAARGRGGVEGAPSQAQRLKALDALLAVYKAVDAPYKPAGVPLAILDLPGGAQGDEVQEFREELRSHVGQLLVDSDVWNSDSSGMRWA
ncbi:hypothetical protein FA95DRAFT_1676450 [Auriscalpium vulgare]|uniref:Uncharacterized protein n=1 Tax=Auriscalpium vulgare TaxID=40419 RepID=A0ACB8S4E5_9AGAM|nr:hypothetical protein FA95DRAFT_1676450 [Auriscalpium vulgare]